MPNVRACIALETEHDVIDFISIISHMEDKYRLEDYRGEHAVNPCSMLGLLYAKADFSGGMYLINLTNDGVFHPDFNRFRLAE